MAQNRRKTLNNRFKQFGKHVAMTVTWWQKDTPESEWQLHGIEKWKAKGRKAICFNQTTPFQPISALPIY